MSKKEKKKSAISRVFQIAEYSKSILTLSCISSIIGYVSGVVPYLSVFFIGKELLIPQDVVTNYTTIALWILISGISILCNMAFSFLGNYGCHYIAFKLLYEFRIKIMEHIGNVSMNFFTEKTTGSMQKTMDESIERIESFVGHMLPDMLGSMFVLLFLLAGLFTLNPWLAITVILSVVVALLLQMSVFGGEKGKKIWSDVAIANQNMTGAFSEYVKGISEVKLFGISGKLTRGLEENINTYKHWELTQYRLCRIPMGLYKSVILSMLTFILPVGIILIQNNTTPETLLSVLMALIVTPCLYDPFMTCLLYGTQMSTLSVGLDIIEDILNQRPLKVTPTSKKTDSFSIAFEDVSFSYQKENEEHRKYAISNINFIAPQGQMTALVGESGSGKSTIGQLISRFWDVESGAILIGGVDIRDIPYESLMDDISFVLQDTFLFSDSIYNNITMNRNYTEEQVIAASKVARCHDFILNTPNGYKTKIGNEGIRLSGGETQRISIARAILKDAPIIILDEALAYSDAENENLIQEAIVDLTKNKTIIIIAHRLQSIMNADQILLLDKGRILEKGTHEQLMAQNTKYHTLWNLQHQVDDWVLTPESNYKGGKE